MKNKTRKSNGKGAASIYRHLTDGNLFGVADRIKLEKKGNARRSRKQLVHANRIPYRTNLWGIRAIPRAPEPRQAMGNQETSP